MATISRQSYTRSFPPVTSKIIGNLGEDMDMSEEENSRDSDEIEMSNLYSR